MDVVDQANYQQEKLLEIELKSRHRTGPAPSGFCHNCGEKTESVFCDADCDYDYNQRLKHNR